METKNLSIKKAGKAAIILIKIVVFTVLFVVICEKAAPIFIPKTHIGSIDAHLSFYDIPAGTIDVLYVGSSPYLRGISPMEIWDEAGIPGFTRASMLIAPEVFYYYVEEAVRLQPNIKTVVFEMAMLFDEYTVDDSEREMAAHVAMDSNPLSFEKVKASLSLTASSKLYNALEFILPAVRHHARWSTLEDYDTELARGSGGYCQMGADILFESKAAAVPSASMFEANPETAPTAFNERNMVYYRKMLDFCNSRGIKLLFYKLPKESWSYGDYLAASNLADEYGFRYIDLNLPAEFEACGLDAALDMYDHGHLSASGAVKASRYLAQKLTELYDLEDKRRDPGYASWNEALLEYEAFIAKKREPV